jgi:octaprenyl-diphosphate synthase
VKNFTKISNEAATTKLSRIKKAFEIINSPLYTVEERIRQQARDFDPAVEGYITYTCESHGKRLRPALTLLASGATGGISSDHVDLAVVLELIHAATLVHDDIMDGADMRRGQPTANAKWGTTISVLLGDCLFAHALKLATSFPDNEISRRISSAASEVCSGEIIQTQRRFDLKLSLSEYYKIIEMKTAVLFATATELGAYLNDAAPEVISAMKAFGLKLGTAYQIYDDCLDIAGNETSAGKSLGSDLRKGKLTLPVLQLLQTSPSVEKEHLNEIILRGDETDIQSLVELVRERGALSSSLAAGRELIEDARQLLHIVPQNKYRTALHEVCETLEIMLGQFEG